MKGDFAPGRGRLATAQASPRDRVPSLIASYDAWYSKVRGQNPNTFFGISDVVRWDTVSIAG
jgi:hypothetical protein